MTNVFLKKETWNKILNFDNLKEGCKEKDRPDSPYKELSFLYDNIDRMQLGDLLEIYTLLPMWANARPELLSFIEYGTLPCSVKTSSGEYVLKEHGARYYGNSSYDIDSEYKNCLTTIAEKNKEKISLKQNFQPDSTIFSRVGLLEYKLNKTKELSEEEVSAFYSLLEKIKPLKFSKTPNETKEFKDLQIMLLEKSMEHIEIDAIPAELEQTKCEKAATSPSLSKA